MLGWWFAASVSSNAVLVAVGAISLLFGLYRLWIERGGRIAASSRSPAWVGALFGIATGFTSQIAHAGGPPFQMWVMPRRLERDVLIGTTAIFFAVLNWIKVPAYVALGQFTWPNALTTLVLLPFALLGSLAGVLAGPPDRDGALLHDRLRADGRRRVQTCLGWDRRLADANGLHPGRCAL